MTMLLHSPLVKASRWHPAKDPICSLSTIFFFVDQPPHLGNDKIHSLPIFRRRQILRKITRLIRCKITAM